MDGPHAPLTLDYKQTVRCYDDTTTVVADIAVGEDSYGPWFSGALRPGLTALQVRCLRNAELSGDWRPYGNGQRELTAILAVNSGGFKVPRMAIAASGRMLGSVGLGRVGPEDERAALVASVLRAERVSSLLDGD